MYYTTFLDNCLVLVCIHSTHLYYHTDDALCNTQVCIPQEYNYHDILKLSFLMIEEFGSRKNFHWEMEHLSRPLQPLRGQCSWLVSFDANQFKHMKHYNLFYS